MSDLTETRVAGDCRDLIDAASGVGEARCGGLTEAVSRAVRQPGGSALLLEPFAETLSLERSAALCHDERHVGSRQYCQYRLKRRVERNRQRFAGLALSHCNLVAINVLPTHAGRVAETRTPIWP